MVKRISALAGAIVLVVAACGGSDDAAPQVASLSNDSGSVAATTTVAPQDVDREAAMMAFTACLRDEGVDIDDPTVDADGNLQLNRPNDIEPGESARELLGEAFEMCRHHIEAITLGFGRVDRTGLEDTLVEFAACMRENGYDMPDPDFSGFGPGQGDGESAGPGPGGGPFGGIDPEDPTFQAAQEACADILARFGPGGPRGGFGPGPGRGGNDG